MAVFEQTRSMKAPPSRCPSTTFRSPPRTAVSASRLATTIQMALVLGAAWRCASSDDM